MALFSSLFYVDSKAVLCSLNATDSTVRSGIHCLLIKGTGATFCWIPSHCGITLMNGLIEQQNEEPSRICSQ